MNPPLKDIPPLNADAHIEDIIVAGEEAGVRLDRVLAARIASLSRSRFKALVLDGHVSIGARTIRDPGYRVNAGDSIKVKIPEPEPARPSGETIPLDIVHEDSDIIVINKPRGLVVHPAAGHRSGTLVNALIAHCGDSLSGIGGERRPGIVHRLDKDTTGVMVAAKNDRAHRKLAAQFADHGRTGPMQRSYLAFVWGVPRDPKGTIDKPIDRHPQSRDKMAIRPNGRMAITHWRLLETYNDSGGKPVASLLECTLETGRTHQIRVHLASIGHPLIGDDVYGPGFRTKTALLPEHARLAVEGLGRQALHAHLLAVEHPETGEFLEFRASLPKDLDALRQALARPAPAEGIVGSKKISKNKR
jgi:23S rRNA pseudouridine1911/1915/1917 synthase